MAKPSWDKHAILAELRRRNMTLTRLAERNGISPGGFRTVWSRQNKKAEQIIADFLDVPVQSLFPARYPKKTTTILSHEYASESTKGQTVARCGADRGLPL